MNFLDSLIYYLKQFRGARYLHLNLNRFKRHLFKYFYRENRLEISSIANFVNLLAGNQNNSNSYIEIGIGDGDIFQGITIKNKVGISGELDAWTDSTYFFQKDIQDLCYGPKFDLALINLARLNSEKFIESLNLIQKCTHSQSLVVVVDSLPYSLKCHLYSCIVTSEKLSSYLPRDYKPSKNLTRIYNYQKLFISFLELYSEKLELVTVVDLDQAVSIITLSDINLGLVDVLASFPEIHQLFVGKNTIKFDPVTSDLIFKHPRFAKN